MLETVFPNSTKLGGKTDDTVDRRKIDRLIALFYRCTQKRKNVRGNSRKIASTLITMSIVTTCQGQRRQASPGCPPVEPFKLVENAY